MEENATKKVEKRIEDICCMYLRNSSFPMQLRSPFFSEKDLSTPSRFRYNKDNLRQSYRFVWQINIEKEKEHDTERKV